MSTKECTVLDFGCHTDNLMIVLDDLVQSIYEAFLTGLAAVLSAIPVPDALVSGTFTLPDGVLWFASVLEIDYGASVMVGAWITRFIIRRIPVIG